ncbi:MAG: hypothetical protein CMM50_02590 [Rhodospirillaceae bacterium]|nr:hypothetical protein [Rhodospirillaceae bacterium]
MVPYALPMHRRLMSPPMRLGERFPSPLVDVRAPSRYRLYRLDRYRERRDRQIIVCPPTKDAAFR